MERALASIGIEVSDAEDFGAQVGPLLDAGDEVQGPGATTLVVWRDESGAGLVAPVGRNGEPETLIVTFFGAARLPARSGAPARRRGQAPFGLIVRLDDGEAPIPVELDDMAVVGHRLPSSGPVELALALFADQVETFRDATAFDEWQQGHGVRHGVPSLLAVAADPDDAEPAVLATLLIDESGTRVNEATGGAFTWMTARVAGGAVDLVAPASEAPPPAGSIVHGTFTAVGRLTAGLLPGPGARPSRAFSVRRPYGRRR